MIRIIRWPAQTTRGYNQFTYSALIIIHTRIATASIILSETQLDLLLQTHFMKDCRKKFPLVYNSFSATQLLGSIFLSEALNASSAWLSKSIICHTSLHWIDEILKARKPGVHSYEIICTIGSSIWKVCEQLPKRRQLWAKGQNMAKHFLLALFMLDTYQTGRVRSIWSFTWQIFVSSVSLGHPVDHSCWRLTSLLKEEVKLCFRKKRI